MAYMNQEMKKELAPSIKKVLSKYGVKGTIGVRNHMVLVVNIKSGKLDICGNWFDTATKYGTTNNYGDEIKKPDYIQVNHFYIDEHYSGQVKDFLLELLSAMKGDNWYDRTDTMTDYFDTAYYLDINIGDWNKPYTVEA